MSFKTRGYFLLQAHYIEIMLCVMLYSYIKHCDYSI